MDGAPFRVPAALAANVSRTLDQWTRTVTSPSRPRLVVQLDAPGAGGVWLVSVFAPSGKGEVVPIDAVLRAERGSRTVAGEWTRLDRLFPALGRAGMRRRGQVALSQDEAWEFMTVVGPTLASVGSRCACRRCRCKALRPCDCSWNRRPVVAHTNQKSRGRCSSTR